jgi:hypothetical protein
MAMGTSTPLVCIMRSISLCRRMTSSNLGHRRVEVDIVDIVASLQKNLLLRSGDNARPSLTRIKFSMEKSAQL